MARALNPDETEWLRRAPLPPEHHDRDSPVTARRLGAHLTRDDWEADARDWAWKYLTLVECPKALASTLVNETSRRLRQDRLVTDADDPTGEVDARKLLQAVYSRIREIGAEWLLQPPALPAATEPWITSTCAVKNSRRLMEDRHVEIPDLNAYFGREGEPCSFYAVFDGHMGAHAAIYGASHLHLNIMQHPEFGTDLARAIVEGFRTTDSQFMAKASRENLKSGATVLCAFLRSNSLHVAWLGDSQAALVRRGSPPIDLVRPHKPDREDERERIEQLGGFVVHIGTWRVGGALAVSRALGDPEYKPFVCADPEIVTHALDGREDFLVLACDGLWDVMTAEDLANNVYAYLQKDEGDAQSCSQQLVQTAMRLGSSDNITVIIVFLRNPKDIVAAHFDRTTDRESAYSSSDRCVSAGDGQDRSATATLNDESLNEIHPETTGEAIPAAVNCIKQIDEAAPKETEDRPPLLDDDDDDDENSNTLWIHPEPAAERILTGDVDGASNDGDAQDCTDRCADVPARPDNLKGETLLLQEYFLASHSSTLKFELEKVASKETVASSSSPAPLFSFDSRPCSHVASESSEDALETGLNGHPDRANTHEAAPDAVLDLSTGLEVAFNKLALDDSTLSVEFDPTSREEESVLFLSDSTLPHAIEVQQLIEMNKLAVSEPNSLGPLTSDEIDESALIAEDVVDDESEEGDDWCYIQGTENQKCKPAAEGEDVRALGDGPQLIPVEGVPTSPATIGHASGDAFVSAQTSEAGVKTPTADASPPLTKHREPGDGLKSLGKTKGALAQSTKNATSKDTGKNAARPQGAKRHPLTLPKKHPIENETSKTMPSKNATMSRNTNDCNSRAPKLAPTAKPRPSTAAGARSAISAQTTLKAKPPTSQNGKDPEKPAAPNFKVTGRTLPRQPTNAAKCQAARPSSAAAPSQLATLKHQAKKPTPALPKAAATHPVASEKKTASTLVAKKPSVSNKTAKMPVGAEVPLSTARTTGAASKLKKDHANKQISTTTKDACGTASSSLAFKKTGTIKTKVPSSAAGTMKAASGPKPKSAALASQGKNAGKPDDAKENAVATAKPKEPPRASSGPLKKLPIATLRRSKTAKPAGPAKTSASSDQPKEMLIKQSSTKETLASPVSGNEKGSLDEGRKEIEATAETMGTEELASAVGAMDVPERGDVKQDSFAS